MRMLPTTVQVSQQHRHTDSQVNRQVNKHGQDEDVTKNRAGQLAAQTFTQTDEQTWSSCGYYKQRAGQLAAQTDRQVNKHGQDEDVPTAVQVSQQHRHTDRQVNRQVNKHGQEEDVTNNCAGQLAAQTDTQTYLQKIKHGDRQTDLQT